MVLRTAVAATFTHARSKIILGLVMAVLAVMLQYALQLRSLNDTEKIAVSLIGSAVLVMAGSLVWNLVRIPAALHIEPTTSTPVKPRHYDEVKAALEELGSGVVAILRYLEKHGKVTVRPPTGGVLAQPYMVPPPPAGTTPREVYDSLVRCVAKFLVTPSESIIQTGGLYPITEVTYQIAAGMKEALEPLLDEAETAPKP